jgi:hypothetical protein
LALTLESEHRFTGTTMVNVLDFEVAPDLLKWAQVKVDPQVPISFSGEFK